MRILVSVILFLVLQISAFASTDLWGRRCRETLVKAGINVAPEFEIALRRPGIKLFNSFVFVNREDTSRFRRLLRSMGISVREAETIGSFTRRYKLRLSQARYLALIERLGQMDKKIENLSFIEAQKTRRLSRKQLQKIKKDVARQERAPTDEELAVRAMADKAITASEKLKKVKGFGDLSRLSAGIMFKRRENKIVIVVAADNAQDYAKARALKRHLGGEFRGFKIMLEKPGNEYGVAELKRILIDTLHIDGITEIENHPWHIAIHTNRDDLENDLPYSVYPKFRGYSPVRIVRDAR